MVFRAVEFTAEGFAAHESQNLGSWHNDRPDLLGQGFRFSGMSRCDLTGTAGGYSCQLC